MAVKDLGELGVVRSSEPIHFGWFGARLRINPGATELVLVDFMEKAKSIDLPDGLDPNDMDSIKDLTLDEQEQVRAALISTLPMVKDFARRCVHPEDFEAFWSAAMANGQTSVDLMGVCSLLVDRASQRAAGRPTGRSRGSISTRPKTSRKLKGDAYLRAGFQPSAVKVIRRLERSGRADLAEAHVQRQEYLLASR